MIQTLTRDIQYNDMVLSVMIYELYSPWDDVILSYGLFYCVGAVVIWSDIVQSVISG